MTEQHMTSLELSKKLKELGVKQESEFYWCEFKDKYAVPIATKPYVIYGTRKWRKDLLTSAFLASELGEMLPGNFGGHYIEYRKGLMGNLWYCSIVGLGDKEDVWRTDDKNEANARAKMLIYLIENGIVEANE